MFYVSPIVGEYEGFEVGRFSKGATIRILWGLQESFLNKYFWEDFRWNK